MGGKESEGKLKKKLFVLTMSGKKGIHEVPNFPRIFS